MGVRERQHLNTSSGSLGGSGDVSQRHKLPFWQSLKIQDKVAADKAEVRPEQTHDGKMQRAELNGTISTGRLAFGRDDSRSKTAVHFAVVQKDNPDNTELVVELLKTEAVQGQIDELASKAVESERSQSLLALEEERQEKVRVAKKKEEDKLSEARQLQDILAENARKVHAEARRRSEEDKRAKREREAELARRANF